MYHNQVGLILGMQGCFPYNSNQCNSLFSADRGGKHDILNIWRKIFNKIQHPFLKKTFSKLGHGASLVAQWLRVCLPMQGTRVRALVWEDPTCRWATRPVRHNNWACASGACAPWQEAATVRGPHTAMKSGPRSPQLEKALAQKRSANTAKINK